MDIFTLNAANKNAEKLVAGLASGIESHEVDNEKCAITFKFNNGSSTTMQVQTPAAKVEKAVNAYLGEKDTANIAINYYDATKYGVSTENEDNSQALQTLIDDIYALGGGTIYIPNGEYHFKNLQTTYAIKLMPNVSIIGENKFLTKLIMDNADVGYTLFFRVYGKSYPLTNATFANFTADATAMTVWETRSKVFYAQYIEDCTFKDLVLIGTPATALGIDMLTNVLIDSIICKDCGHMYDSTKNGSSGIGIGCGGYEDENITISNCICIGSGQYGIFVEEQVPHGWGGEYEVTKGCNIINNVVRNGLNCGIGVRGMKGVTISGNTVYNNTKNGIYVDGGYQLTISGNTVFDNVESGVCINPDTCNIEDVMISANNITGNKTGVTVKNNSADLVNSGITVIGNFIRGNTENALNLTGKVTDLCVKGNAIFGEIESTVLANGKSMLDDDIPFMSVLEDSECPYKLDNLSAYSYKMVLLIDGTYYAYASNSAFYIYADGTKYYEVFINGGYTKRATTTSESCGSASDVFTSIIIEEDTKYGYTPNGRTLAQFVWTNADIKQWGTDTVLVTAGSHE